ncbi:hypothetical protein AALB19_02815 [Oscillospiraceae bacterium 50-58]
MGTICIVGGRKWNGRQFEPNGEMLRQTNQDWDRKICLDDSDMILPGVIDMHAHVWTPYASKKLCIPVDRTYYKGVVAVADAGSFGCHAWHKSNRFLMDTANQKVKMFMHVLPVGLTGFPLRNFTQVENVDLDRVIEIAGQDKSGNLLGFKIHLGLMDVKHDEKLMKAARTCADALGKPVEMHVSGARAPFELISEYLKPGDVVAHAFSGRRDPILDENGKIKGCVKEAVSRGVHLDVAHAGKHFSWRVFRQARDEGVLFDFIGTDSTMNNYENEDRQMMDIFHVASALMNAGVDEEYVVNAMTANSAGFIGYELNIERQTVVLKRIDKIIPFYDDASEGLKDYIIGDHEYKPVLFWDDGRVIYDNPDNAK